MKAVLQWVLRTMMKDQTGVMRTLPKKDLVDFNVAMTAERLMQNGIDPRALKNADQVENAIKQIEAPRNVQQGIKSTESAKIFDMEGKEIPKGSKIMGGKQSETEAEILARINEENKKAVKSLKERKRPDVYTLDDYDTTNMSDIKKEIIKTETKLGNLNPKSSDFRQQAKPLIDKIEELKDQMSKIKEDDLPMAQGGRAGYASGGITALKALLNFFAKQRGTKGSQQLKEINPKSVPSGIMNIMGPEHRKMLERNQTDYLESLLDTIKSDKKFLDKNKEIAKQVQKDIDEAGFGDFTTAEKMLQPFIESAMKGGRLDRMKVYDKINIDDAIMDIEQMIKNRRMRESDGRALNASGGRIGYKDGPDQPGRRKFMKIMGGLATLPILGKFVKPAMPLIQKGAEITAPALDKIIDIVMSAGKLVSQSGRRLKELTTKKKLKDIEVEEDMMDGPSYTIKTKDKTIYYKPGKQDEMGIEDDIIEVIEDTVTKKASGGVARMLGE